MELDRRMLELAKETGKIELIVQGLTERLVKEGNFELRYMHHIFYFQEMEYANPMDFSSTTMISVHIPSYMWDMCNFSYGASYDSTYSRNSRTTYINRIKACKSLAEDFVYKILPKIDFWIKKEINNKEIEDILGVLE